MKLALFFCYVIVTVSLPLNSRIPPKRYNNNVVEIRSSTTSTITSLHSTNNNLTDEIKGQIQSEISTTKRGLSTTQAQESSIESLLQKLELECPLAEPARSPLMGGKWIVDYTTSPPPSNGKLGPFVGFARQIIDLEQGTYVNYLSVPGDIEKEWLSAKLEATFSEWDGVLLKDDRADIDNGDDDDNYDNDTQNNQFEQNDIMVKKDNEPSSADPKSIFAFLQDLLKPKGPEIEKSTKTDYGADSWKVDFQTLTIKAFGVTLITKKFENTSRVWKMSYLDDETRIGKCTKFVEPEEKECCL